MHGNSGTSVSQYAQAASRTSPGETFLFIADADKSVGGSRAGRDPNQISRVGGRIWARSRPNLEGGNVEDVI